MLIKQLNIKFIFLAILYLMTGFDNNIQAGERLRLIGADKLEQTNNDGRIVKKLTRNVVFQKGEITLKCDLAYWYEKEQWADFLHNVSVLKDTVEITTSKLSYDSNDDIITTYSRTIIKDGKNTLQADSVRFFVEQDKFEIGGKVFLKNDTQQLNTDFLVYNSDNDKAISQKNSRLKNLKDNTMLIADSLIYYKAQGNIEAFLNPELIRSDSTGEESFKIKGNVIRLNEKNGGFSSDGNVIISKDKFRTHSDFADYTDSLGLINLKGNPIVINEKQKISGQKMQVKIKNEKLEYLFVDGKARAETTVLSYLPDKSTDTTKTQKGDSLRIRDEISGQLMKFFFRDGSADSICISSMASSYYNVQEDSIIQGVNLTSGDTIIMDFHDKDLEKIIVIGGTKGQFIPHETNTSVDTAVVYSSERIEYYLKDKSTNLRKNASVKSGDAKLTAGIIDVKWKDNLLYAYPEEKSETDTAETGLPTLEQDGKEPFTGHQMVYNIKTRKGRIVEGNTKAADGYYYGENISKAEEDVFYIEQGKYTTCDKPDHPHFYFKSKKMKLIQKDKIIARPIVLYIHDIPLIGLPFGVFPSKAGGRHDGWIMPTYGESRLSGHYLRGLGYFWAPSDYYDTRLTTDFFDQKGMRLNFRTRYKKMYQFNGNINGFYDNQFFSPSREKVWKLAVNHRHTISPTMKLNVNGSFISNDSFNQRYGMDQSTRLNQQVISNATLSKTWPGKPYSFSMNLNQTTNLQAKTKIKTLPTRAGSKTTYIRRTLPSISLSRGRKALIPLKKGRSATNSKWYNNIFFNINSKLQNKQDIYYMSAAEADSFLWEEQNELKNAITHNISLNASQKLFKYITINQSMSLREGWIFEYEKPVYDENGNFIIEDNQVLTTTSQGFMARHTGNASLNAQTKLYGLFPVNIGGLQSLRHVVTPSVGLSYTPDFTEDIFGWNPEYVQTGFDSSGQSYEYDPFYTTLLGATPSHESQSMNLRVSNVFQAKIKSGEKIKKLDLLTLNFSTRNNLVADSMNWAPLRTSIRTNLSKKLVLNISTTHDFYAYKGHRVDEWHKTWKSIPIPRLTSMSANTGFSLSGKDFGSYKNPANFSDTTQTDSLDSIEELLNPLEQENITRDNSTQTASKQSGSKLWNATFNFRYSLNKNNPLIKNESFSMNMRLKMNITRKWKIGYSARFDLMEKRLLNQNVNISRDLHCWELSFNWVPGGYGKQYSLLIRVKAPTLKDLKYEEKGGRRSGPYY